MPQKLSYPIRRSVVRDALVERGWNYQDLANAAGLDRKSITNAFQGRRLEINSISAIADAIGKSCDEVAQYSRRRRRSGTSLSLANALTPEQLSNGHVTYLLEAVGIPSSDCNPPDVNQVISALTIALQKEGVQLVALKARQVHPNKGGGGDMFGPTDSHMLVRCHYSVAIAKGYDDHDRPFWALCVSTSDTIRRFSCDVSDCPLDLGRLIYMCESVWATQADEPPAWMQEHLLQQLRFPSDGEANSHG